ncbi:MAG TPA: carboxypeptidase-like regulatory domain-containing protein, partial [Puia sp.]|nr:carboxypeptidase-like regulatory domain-containing protein [Puia sp.]
MKRNPSLPMKRIPASRTSLPLLFFLLTSMAFSTARAGRITGRVTDDKGAVLAYSSVFVKGTTKGVTANNEGKYFLDLDPGSYTLVCQYVGYTRQEKKISIEPGQTTTTLDFRLYADLFFLPGIPHILAD